MVVMDTLCRAETREGDKTMTKAGSLRPIGRCSIAARLPLVLLLLLLLLLANLINNLAAFFSVPGACIGERAATVWALALSP